MNDFDFDVLQKKRVANSARHRVCGSKSKYCGLPSDHLTPAQLRAKSGPVTEWNLTSRMSWDAFRGMRHDLQQEYISGLQARFRVSIATIGKELFRHKSSALSVYMSSHGLKGRQDGKGKRMDAKDRDAWANWLNGEEMAPPAAQEDAVQENAPAEGVDTSTEEKPQEEPQNEKQEASFEVSELTATFTGEFDSMKFLGWLARLPMPGGSVKIRVDVTKV